MSVILPDDYLSQFSRSVFTINGILLDAGEAIAQPLGLSVAKWHVLGRANSKNRTVAQIARYIGVSRQSVQRIANNLETDGLVMFKPDKTDARTKIVALTRTGEHALEQLYAADKVWSEGFIEQIDFTRLLQLTRQLSAVSKELVKYSERTFDEV